ncbi:MAG: PilZ domain-containing protein [Candidatus Omnitrophica bacterium]|nr:PilZ domain-containing protein [Candidatus Omnitrophota bacterium]
MPHHEKRRFIRHLLVSPLEFKVSESEEFQKTETVDISEGGLLFVSRQDVAVGTVIFLQVPVYDKVFKIKAKVVHVKKDDLQSLYRIGVEFQNYADAFKVKLIEQIYLIEEYRVLRSLQEDRDMSLKEASEEWIKRYSERFKKLYW